MMSIGASMMESRTDTKDVEFLSYASVLPIYGLIKPAKYFDKEELMIFTIGNTGRSCLFILQQAIKMEPRILVFFQI